MRLRVDLVDLPAFTVDEIGPVRADGSGIVIGRFSHLRGIRGSRGHLYRERGASILAELSAPPPSLGERLELWVPEVGALSGVAAGAAFPWIDGYWEPVHVAAILAGHWERREVRSLAARHFRLGTAEGWQPIDATLPEGAEDLGVREGAWDHEHCELCRARIGIGGAVAGFVAPAGLWLCGDCHARFAEPRDLSFLIEL